MTVTGRASAVAIQGRKDTRIYSDLLRFFASFAPAQDLPGFINFYPFLPGELLEPLFSGGRGGSSWFTGAQIQPEGFRVNSI